MPERPQLPPPDVMIPELRTPNPSDVFFRELVSRESSRWQQNNPIKRGTKYSSLIGVDQRTVDAFPDLYFLVETVPIGSNTVAGMTQDGWVVWNWMTSPIGESATNAEISLLADGVSNPVYARVYTIRRSVYEASPTIATGTPFTGLLGAKVLNGGINYKNARCALFGPGSGGKITPVISGGVITHFVVERDGEGFDVTSTMQVIGDGQDAEGQLLLQPPAAILTSQKKIEFPDGDPRGNEFVKVLRVYEVLPGPWIPFTRYDDDLGPIQGRRRAVLNTGQRGGVISATGKRNYEGRDGSSVVSIEIEENFSDGSGSDPNNPTYPVLFWDIYVDERGAVQRKSQIVVAPGAAAGQSPEEATLVYDDPKVIKTWFEPYQDNPFLLKKFVEVWQRVVKADRELTSQFGGAIASVSERIAEVGEQTPERGLLVIESGTQTLNPHEQRLRTKKAPGTAWPVLHGHDTDPISGIVINYTKQVVPAGTPYPGRNDYRGPIIEMQPYDFDKSIQIISVLDRNTLPGPEAWPITHLFSMPPTLLAIEAVWSDVVARLVNAQAESANVMVASGSSGGVIIRRKSGYRGYAKGVHARDYFYGSPPLSAIPTPLKIIPSSGSVVLTQTNSRTHYQAGDDGGVGFGDNFSNQVFEKEINDHLVGNFQILNDTHQSPPKSALAQSGGGTIASVSAEGTISYMTVSIPQSDPPALVSGQEILVDCEVTEWRKGHGVWIVDRIYVTIP